MLSELSYLWDGSLGVFKAVEHHIKTTGNPVASQPYRAGPGARQDIDKEIDRMLDAKAIEPADSEWASPIVLIPKLDGSVRFFIDYRKLNSINI